MIAVSSGSTGTPAFWPRFVTDELAIAVRFEQVFHDSFHADSRLTLTVVCFALGTWVGGMYTAACCRHLAAKGTLLFSGDNGIPLVRYHISDAGGLVDYPAMLRFLKGGEFDPLAALEPGDGRAIRPLPFTFVFGRSHFVISSMGHGKVHHASARRRRQESFPRDRHRARPR